MQPYSLPKYQKNGLQPSCQYCSPLKPPGLGLQSPPALHTSVFQAPTRMMTLLSHAFLVQSPKTFYIPLTNSMVWLVTAIDPFLVPTSGYFSIAVMKYHDQGNLQRKCFICCPWFQRMRVHGYHGRECGSRQAVMVLEPQMKAYNSVHRQETEKLTSGNGVHF